MWEQATIGHWGQIQEVVFHVFGRHFVRSRLVYESLRSNESLTVICCCLAPGKNTILTESRKSIELLGNKVLKQNKIHVFLFIEYLAYGNANVAVFDKH